MDFLKYKNTVIVPSGILLDKTIGYGDSTYLMQHAIIRKLIATNKYKIGYEYAQNSMFKLHDNCKWENECLLNNGAFSIIDLITFSDTNKINSGNVWHCDSII